MKRIDFDMGKAAARTSVRRERRARKALSEYQPKLLEMADVAGFGVSSRSEGPYIWVMVTPGAGDTIQERIPDEIDGVEVFYVEGQSSLV